LSSNLSNNIHQGPLWHPVLVQYGDDVTKIQVHHAITTPSPLGQWNAVRQFEGSFYADLIAAATSDAVGIAGCAPAFKQASEPAMAACSSDVSKLRPASNPWVR
jgi:hypothetical protein